jgi:hypothetical protein
MKLSEKQQIFTFNVSLLIQYAYGLGIKLTFGEAHRTNSQVLLNYFGYKVIKEGGAIKLKKSRKLSSTLKSKHPDRLAIDFNFFIDGELAYDKEKLKCLGEYWERLDERNSWGGNWKRFSDTPHFEMK